MKKIVLSVALMFCILYLNAQDEGVIQLFVQQKQYEKAKEQVDKWVADPKLKDKEKPNAYLSKLLVYSSIYADSSLSGKYPDANAQALDALEKYKALDPSLKIIHDGNYAAGVGNLYSTSFNKGRAAFQNKDWETAYTNFYESERLGDFLLTNKLSSSTSTVDTATVLFTAYAAQNSKRVDTAAMYYAKLAELKLSGADYEDIYKYLVSYYSEKKDEANFQKYLAISKQLYPNDNIWTQYEMNAMTANAKLPDLYQSYMKDAAAGSMNEDKLIGYAEALATNDQAQLEGIDSLQKINIKIAAANAFAKASELNSNNGLYAYNAGVIYYGVFNDLDDRYHAYTGESAALKAKRTDIAKMQSAYGDTAAQWLEKGFPVLQAKTDRTRQETNVLNYTVRDLANIYQWKRDRTKVDGNSKDYDKYDAMYKKYDDLYNTFK